MALRPEVFVGSSSEAKYIAREFCNELASVAEMIPWWRAPEFEVMHATLDDLADALDVYDFGLFILSADDQIVSRGQKDMSARDNVLFELGLFLGKLGRNRAFAVKQDGVKVPSDFLGVNLPPFNVKKGNKHQVIASVGVAADKIARIITHEGRRQRPIKLVDSWGYNSGKHTYTMNLSKENLERHKGKLVGSQLVLVAMKKDDAIDWRKDRRIKVGRPRTIGSGPIISDIKLTAQSTSILGKADKGDKIDGHLFLVPEELDLHTVKTISDIYEADGDLLESKGKRV